jgi:hypothetical protein
MRAALLALAVLAACHRDTRSESCATVKTVLERHDPHGGMPRRYYDYAEHAPIQAFDPDVARDLANQHYADPDVAAATRATADTSWTVYTPYSTDHDTALDRLRTLCHLEGARITLE